VRLYFHLTNGEVTIPDLAGFEVTDVEAARSEVDELISELIRIGDYDAAEWRGWRFEIADASGTVLVTVSLSMH
jgi:hypothetical protein